MEASTPPRERRRFTIAGFEISVLPRLPRQPGVYHLGRLRATRLHRPKKPLSRYFPAKAAAAVGIAAAFAHEVAYRQVPAGPGEEKDFTLGLISHAAIDMLFLTTLPTVLVLILVARGRIR